MSRVITASCTLLSPGHISDGSCPSTPTAVQAITLHTSSQKIVVPVAAVCASSPLPANGDRLPASSSTTSAEEQHPETAADGASQKPAAPKTGSSNPVTRRLRFQAKPNISKNARTR